MTTKKPTLAEIQGLIISCLKNNQLPGKGDALQFFSLVKSWLEEKSKSFERRQIFETIFETYKRRCVANDPTRRKNEIWAAINAVIDVWEERKDIICPAKKKAPSSTPFSSLSFNLTWLNH